MSARFSRKGRSFPKGRPTTSVKLNVLLYKGFKVEYSFYDIAELYLISIYRIVLLPSNPFLEFLVSPPELQGQGVENYLMKFLDSLHSYLENDPIKREVSELYNVSYESVTDEQAAAFTRAKEIIKNYYSKNS